MPDLRAHERGAIEREAVRLHELFLVGEVDVQILDQVVQDFAHNAPRPVPLQRDPQLVNEIDEAAVLNVHILHMDAVYFTPGAI